MKDNHFNRNTIFIICFLFCFVNILKTQSNCHVSCATCLEDNNMYACIKCASSTQAILTDYCDEVRNICNQGEFF